LLNDDCVTAQIVTRAFDPVWMETDGPAPVPRSPYAVLERELEPLLVADCGVVHTHAEPLYVRVFLVSVS